MFALLLLLLAASGVQGFYNYHNWKVRQWCDHFGFRYNMVGGPPKSWEWPWNWSMVTYVSISKKNRRMVNHINESIDQHLEPSLDEVRKLINHAKHLPKLGFVGIYISFSFAKEDLVNLKNVEQIVIHTSTKFTDDELKFIRSSMPKTIVSIKFVE